MMVIKNKRGEAIFTLPNMDTPDFDGMSLPRVDLSQAMLEGAIFSDTNLEGASLKEADLYWAIFYRANLRNAVLDRALMRGADLREADFTGASLRDADLGKDNVGRPTQLQGARLAGAEVTGACFEGAEYDFMTIFPEGFDPNAHGMVFSALG